MARFRQGCEAEDLAEAADRWLQGDVLTLLDERSTFGVRPRGDRLYRQTFTELTLRARGW